jgi:Double-GTPase 2
MNKYKQGPPKEIICPHPRCFERFPLWDIRFRDSTGKVYAPHRPLLARLQRVPPMFANGPHGEQLFDKVCPRCGGSLPYTAGEQTDVIIGLVGAKFSGKSHFVATLLDRLEGPVGRAFDASLLHVDDATVTRRTREFQEPLRHGLELPVTDPDAPPLLYNFTVQGNRGGYRHVTLVLCDTAGENFDKQDDVTERTRFLSCASGLIFLVDPLQTTPVRQVLPTTVKFPQQMTAPNVILGRVVQELTKRGSIDVASRGRKRKLAMPVAAAFTKCDTLRDTCVIDPHCLWSQDIHHEGRYDLSLHHDVHGMFSEYMNQWDLAVWNTIRTHFATFAFFGVSATGCSSDEKGRYARIAPWRVEDPLLWLLYQLGIIPGSADR